MKEARSIVSDFLASGWESKPYQRMVALATGDRASVVHLVEAVLSDVPKGGTFFDGALSFLAEHELARVIGIAMHRLDDDPESEAASSVVAYASLQLPHLLADHLLNCWQLQPNRNCYYEFWPWRGATDVEVSRLLDIANRSGADADRAWECLLETRRSSLVDQAARALAGDITYEQWLNQVGFTQRSGDLVTLHAIPARHIHFEDGFFDERDKPPWLSTSFHPTWSTRPTDGCVALPFGGLANAECTFCGGELHRLFELASGDHTTRRSTPVTIATCLSCLGWEECVLFYTHDAEGRPTAINPDRRVTKPEFPSGPLREARAHLVPLSERWACQDWALSNSRENLNRVGGTPCWVQSADYPECHRSSTKMTFIAQLDSNLPTDGGDEWLWGSGGICYVFWCDGCGISATHWQCT